MRQIKLVRRSLARVTNNLIADCKQNRRMLFCSELRDFLDVRLLDLP
ncbi:MAG: hypothetical protein ACLPZY_07195 [Terracidiphilus sp.]